MWSDNETTVDLLGFKVHADLIRSVVTDASVLPVVMGVFGDWGGGKSSIMRMLERDLNAEEYKDTVCLYFNGWMFEGYEDAKSALLSSILIQLGEHKRFGKKVKGRVAGLLKRVEWMEVAKLGVKHVGVPLVVSAMTGGVGAIPAAAAALVPALFKPAEAGEEKKGGPKGEEKEEENWLDLVRKDPSKPDLLEIRKFREDFEKMLADTKIKTLVILIDDLDRCLPERIIETLEAIKLFVAVPRTAFVIGADPRIVRHAIATRYVARQLRRAGGNRGGEDARKEEYDLVTDYLEKLIQVPYHLPRLSPSEVETYINLLACQKGLDGEACGAVLKDWESRKRDDFHMAYRQGAIREALRGAEVPAELERQLSWSNAISLVLTEGLKGNPRQVKRMLNAMILRRRLADIAGLRIREDVLAKLMVLEYTQEKLFRELNDWQTTEGGFPQKLRQLEEAAIAGDERPSQEDGYSKWRSPSVQKWLQMQPPLGDVDLRDYFWLARDKTSSTLAGVTVVSTHVRRLFDDLTGDDEIKHLGAVNSARELEDDDRESLLSLLQQLVERHPDREEGPEALYSLAKERVKGAASALFEASRNASASDLTPSVAFKVQTLAQTDPGLLAEATALLRHLTSFGETRIAAAAEQALSDLQGSGG